MIKAREKRLITFDCNKVQCYDNEKTESAHLDKEIYDNLKFFP